MSGPAAPQRHRPGLLLVFGLLLLWILQMRYEIGVDESTAYWLRALVVAAAAVAVVSAAPRLVGEPDPYGLLRTPSWGLVWRSVATYAVMAPVLVWLSTREGRPEDHQEVAKDLADGGAAAAIFVFAVLVVPVAEELIFRGGLQATFERLMPVPLAVLAAAFAFTVVHPRAMMAPVFLLALLLGFARARSRGLILSIGIHAAHNALAFLLLVGKS